MNGQREWTPLLEAFGKAVTAEVPDNGRNRFYWWASRIGILFGVLCAMALLGTHYEIAAQVNRLDAHSRQNTAVLTEVVNGAKDLAKGAEAKTKFDLNAARQLGIKTSPPAVVIAAPKQAEQHYKNAENILRHQK